MLLGHYFSREHHFCILLRVKLTKFQISSNQVKILLKLFRSVYLVGVGHTKACDLILIFHTQNSVSLSFNKMTK